MEGAAVGSGVDKDNADPAARDLVGQGTSSGAEC